MEGDGEMANVGARVGRDEKTVRKKLFSLKVRGTIEITETWARFEKMSGGACALGGKPVRK